jgi:hypothetical protein
LTLLATLLPLSGDGLASGLGDIDAGPHDPAIRLRRHIIRLPDDGLLVPTRLPDRK